MNDKHPFLRRLWARLTGHPAPKAGDPAPAPKGYEKRHCARCGRLLAHSRGGEWSWAHACADGYGVVHLDGRFEPRDRRRVPTLLPTPIPLCPRCRAPQPCGCQACEITEVSHEG